MRTEQASRFGPEAPIIGEAQPVDEQLLTYLRMATNASAMQFEDSPTRVIGGFDTAIWSFRVNEPIAGVSGPMILRVYRDGGDDQARFEAAVQNAMNDRGYPVPRMLLTCADHGVIGSAFTIMPRMPGRVMLERMIGPSMRSTARTMGRLHAELHALEAEGFVAEITQSGVPQNWLDMSSTLQSFGDRIEAASLDGLAPAFAWIGEQAPASPRTPKICHGDFHPLNVLMNGKHVSAVLDWSYCRIADPMWDVGATVALIGHGPVDLPGFLLPLVVRVRRWLLGNYLAGYEQLMPLDRERLKYFEAVRLLGFMLEVAEHRQAIVGAIPSNNKPVAFDDDRVLAGIVRRFTDVTGITPSLPPKPPAG